jgi:hypothetical protein
LQANTSENLEDSVARNECHGGHAGKANYPQLVVALMNPRCDLDHSGDVISSIEA